MDIEQFRKAGYQAIDRICDYYASINDRPVRSNVTPGYLAKCLPDASPEQGEDFQVIADDYQKYIIPGLTHWQHPSFFAYYPTACTFEGILGDLYASSIPNPGFNWAASPACTELEGVVMDWAAKLLGLGHAFLNSSGIGGGALQTTASESALIAVVAARSLYQRNHPDVPTEKLVLYTTTQTHSLGVKAGLILGVTAKALEVRAEDNYGLRGDTLARALEEDHKAGLHPFVLIATVGTTSSGATDNITEIAQVVNETKHDIWIHVDAAWAGIALSCPEYREAAHLDAINSTAHSFCTNFHKWGLVNFDASTLWVRQRKYLIDALEYTPAFLRTVEGDSGMVIDYRNWQLALGRRFRSLKLWFVLRAYGVEGFQKHIRRHVKLNEHFVELVKSSKLVSIVTPPALALTVFRLDPQNDAGEHLIQDPDELNALNEQLYKRISQRDDISLTQTKMNGVFCIRMAIGAVRTEESHIDKAFKLITEEAEVTLKAREVKN